MNATQLDFAKLKQAAHDARELANRCFHNDVTGMCTEQGGAAAEKRPPSCLEREEHRLKGYPALPSGATRRGFSFYDPEKLCRACRPYWFAEMAALALEESVKGERLIARDEGREQEVAIDADRLRELLPVRVAEALIAGARGASLDAWARAEEAAKAVRAEHEEARARHAAAVALLDAAVLP